MDGCLAVLHPFQQYFSYIRTRGDDTERLCAMEPCLCLKIWPRAVLEPRTARSVGQRLTHRAAGAFFYENKSD